MSSTEDMPIGSRSHTMFLSEISEMSPAFRDIRSLSLGTESDIDNPAAISRFSLLLSTLRVPGPCELILNTGLAGNVPLGSGAQFIVSKQEVNGLTSSNVDFEANINRCDLVAIKSPKFVLDKHQKLDLSRPEVDRQVRHMIVEITALCHPRLRDHANIVDLLSWGMSNENWHGVPFLALELADNTLASFLSETDRSSVQERHHISLDIGCALDAIHEIGLVHGDLKPENVLLFTEAGCWVAKLADFGGGADLGQGGVLAGRGTPGWRAPELVRFLEDGEPLDQALLERVDNYSYGLLLWSIFSRKQGSAPYLGNIEVEQTAHSELEAFTASMEPPLPPSIILALKTSFNSLLKQDPLERARVVGNLLDDGSGAYSVWRAWSNSRGGTFTPGIMNDSPAKNCERQYAWEITEISSYYAIALRSAFLSEEPLTLEIINALCMNSISAGRPLHYDVQIRELLLGLLHAGAREGSELIQAMIASIYDHFQMQPTPEISERWLLWIDEAVARGAFYLQKTLGQANESLLQVSIQRFRENGGFNRFYAGLDRKWTWDFVSSTSLEPVVEANIQTSLNLRGDRSLHLLSSITASEQLAKVLTLLDQGEVNEVNKHGETALYRACMAGVTSNVLLLLSCGADASIAPSDDGPTCLHWLFHFPTQDLDNVGKGLIKHGGCIHSRSRLKIPMPYYPFTLPVGTPLHWAVETSVPEAVQSLLRQGASPSLRDGSDPYAFDEDVRDLDKSLLPNMVHYSVSKNPTMGLSAIDVAVKDRDHEILAVLLQDNSKFDYRDTDEEGYTALHRLDAGEWRYTCRGSAVWCPLFQGSTNVRADSLKKTVAVLLEHGFELNRFTNSKKPSVRLGFRYSRRTALMIAVAKGCSDTVKVLIDAEADVNITNPEGDTALLLLRDEPHEEARYHSEIAFLLLNANANLHVRDSGGNTPFIRAAGFTLLSAAAALLDHGANLQDRNVDLYSSEYGFTAFALLTDTQGILFAKTKNTKNFKEHDEWLTSQLNMHVLPRLTDHEGLELRSGLLEKADLDGGTLLHHTARGGLIRSCKILMSAAVNLNGLRRSEKPLGKFKDEKYLISYRTPLDEAIDYGKTLHRDLSRTFSEQECTMRLNVYGEIAQLLKDAGGVRAETMAANHVTSFHQCFTKSEMNKGRTDRYSKDLAIHKTASCTTQVNANTDLRAQAYPAQ